MERRPAGRRGPALRVTLLAALLGGGACGTEPEPEPTPTAIDVTGPTQRIAIGGTAKVAASVQTASGPLAGAKLTWASHDTTTATVDATGNVIAVRAGEAWIVGTVGAAGTAGVLSDSTLIEVVYAAQARDGRVRIRTGGAERSLVVAGRVEPVVVQWDYLGRGDEDYWEVDAGSGTQDTVLAVLLPDLPDGSKLQLADLTAVQTDGDDSQLTKPLAFLDISTPGVDRIVPLLGYVEAGVDQTVPASLRLGLSHIRLVGRGNAWRSTSSGGFIISSEVFDVVADLRPALLHLPIGASTGSLTGTQPNQSWTLREVVWGPTTTFGRTALLQVQGPPAIAAYMPGTATADLGTSAETTRGLLTLRDSVAAYAATASAGRVTVTQYTAPAAADLFGEIKGTVTANGTGTLGVAAPAAFSASFDFDAPIPPPALSGSVSAVPAAGTAQALLERVRRLRALRAQRGR